MFSVNDTQYSYSNILWGCVLGFWSLFIFVADNMEVPRIVSLQDLTDTTCTMHACNNWFQDWVFSDFVEWKVVLRDLWLSGPGYGRSDRSKEMMVRQLIGEKGISGDLLLLFFKSVGILCKNVTPCKADQIKSGILFIWCNERFCHCIAIKNGYVLDSLNDIVYEWDGKVKGYKSAKIHRAVELK